MEERKQIICMQIRMARRAASEWGVSVGEAAQRLAADDALDFIEELFPLFHMEGDEAVFQDVLEYMARREGETVAASI